jgi:cytochrome P450
MPPLELSYNVGITYEAGSDTITMAMEVFVMATVLYRATFLPKVRKEIDYMVGQNRLPAFSDIQALLYLQAIVNEVLRYRPRPRWRGPTRCHQDDEYMGYCIPAGATVIGNHWAIHLDEDVYNDPYSFNPDRWIEYPNLPLNTFGFGRGVCTGQHIARNSLLINITRILWAFDIGYKYENGVREDINPLAMTQVSTPDRCHSRLRFRSDTQRFR